MKFGQYLSDNSTPEWKRAYIDYRACKKAIKRVSTRLSQSNSRLPHGQPRGSDGADEDSSGDDDHGPAKPRLRRTGTASASSAASGTSPRPGTMSGASPGALSVPPTAGSESLSVPSSRGSKGHSTVPTPLSALSKHDGSYGAMGTSPRPETQHISLPPPLDIGEPSVAPTDAQEQPQDPLPSAHSRLQKSLKRGVNFSPLVEAIPDAERSGGDSSSGARSVEDTKGDETSEYETARTQSEGTVSQGAPTPQLGPNVTRLRSNSGRRKGHHGQGGGHNAANRAASQAMGAGFAPRFSPKISPKMSLVSPRVQPSVGVSTSSVKDAPSGQRSIRSLTLPSPRIQPRTARTFEELYDSLAPDEQDFFDILDHELDKVETFYQNRETEAALKGHELRDQLRDLAEHRRIFHEQYPEGIPEWEAKMARIGRTLGGEVGPVKRTPFNGADYDHVLGTGASSGTSGGVTPKSNGHGNGVTKGKGYDDHKVDRQFDPERYQKYKKDLRVAMLEFYRHLELIKNYRILNLTGFRKALKKFEKATGIICLDLYTEDRIAPCSFSRSEVIDGLIRQTEELFTEHFEHGDSKRARDKLRRQNQVHTHYTTVLRSGLMLGLALPAAVLAIVKSFEPATREAMPEYQALLQVYAAFYFPVIFALLFELNLIAWVAARINYEFVMELARPTLDFRSYAEIPSFFFMTLSYCFFFSFYRVAAHNVAPSTWPLAWLVFVCAFFLNPLPVLRRRSRFWLLRVLFAVITPGYSRVEFIVFFMADELNSLVYSIQNIFFMSCAYNRGWENVYTQCKSGSSWPYALLASIPPLIRLIQCVKRWWDSNLTIHLVNGGKYCSSIMSACMMVYWRSRGGVPSGPAFILWVLFATIASIYTASWDLVVDWSLLRPHCKLLRPDLGYANKFVYYWAMATNIIIRFIWVWYIPNIEHHKSMRSWIFALLEMLRRWQWNFFRVETEHLGNADAYRVTREIPLPYRRLEDSASDDEQGFSQDRHDRKKLWSKWTVLRRKLIGRQTAGRGPDALNVGPRGHAEQREYVRSSSSLPAEGSDSASVV